MDDKNTGIESLQLEKAIVLAASAALAWHQQTANDEQFEDQSLALLMKACAWASMIRREHSLSPLNLPEMLELLPRPMSEWMPGAENLTLVHDNEPTEICHEYADSAGINPEQEIEQGIIRQVMNNLLGDASGADKYSMFRKFLVENAHALKKEAAAAVQKVGVDLSQIYGPIPSTALVRLKDGQEYFFPCPRCKWPMTKQDDLISCATSPNCIKAGAQFSLFKNRLSPLGQLLPPDPLPCGEYAAILKGLWRYTVLPGLEELYLFDKISNIPGVKITLYPNFDACDLDVRTGNHHWRVDVKDYVSHERLGRHLQDNPAAKETWVVVPDRSEHFVALLNQRVPDNTNYRFTSSSKFIQSVKDTANKRKVS